MSIFRKTSDLHATGYPQSIDLTYHSDTGCEFSMEVKVVEKATVALPKGKNVLVDPPEGTEATEYAKRAIRKWYKENNMGSPRFYSEEKAAEEKRTMPAPLDDKKRKYLQNLVRVYGMEPPQGPVMEKPRKRSFLEAQTPADVQALDAKREKQQLRVTEAEESYKHNDWIVKELEKHCAEAREKLEQEIEKMLEHAKAERDAAFEKHDSELDNLFALHDIGDKDLSGNHH